MERELLYKDALAGISSAKWELQERANRLSKQKRTILHTASMDGSIEQVKYILREFASHNFLVKLDSNKETALHIAASKGHVEVVKGLIDAARSLPTLADDNISNAISGFEAFVRQVNESKNTALHLALNNGSRAIAKLLVNADPKYKHNQNSQGESPIYLAAKSGYMEILKMICEECDDPTVNGPQGETALHFAILKLSEEKKEDDQSDNVVELLIKAAKKSLTNHNRFEAFLRQADKNEDTTLHLAVRGNHLDVVKLILEADPTYPQEIKNNDSETAIYIAAKEGYKDIVEVLRQHSTSGYSTPGPKNQTALHVAIIGRHTDCVRSLLRQTGCPLTSADDKGWTPLHCAAHQKFDSVLDDIVNKSTDKYGHGDKVTPLCIAAEEGHTSTVTKLIKLLPKSCADVNDKGQNMLHIAAGQSDKETVLAIIKNCPTDFTHKVLNGKDNDGNTPLHLLIREGCFVPELIKHKGIDITLVTNNKNWTPLDMLYVHEKIVGEQLQIKKAVEHTRAKQNWKFWRRRTENKQYTQESIVPPRIRAKKDAEFSEANRKLMQEELKYYRQRTNTQIIVTALITTVTFTVGFTLPGGYYQSDDDDRGLALLSKRAAFNAFMVTDTLALALSTTSLFLYFISTMYQDPHKVSKFNAASTVLNIVSVIAMMLTFLTGTYVVLSKSRALAITVCVIICLFFLLVIVLSIQMIYDRKDRKIEKTEV